MSILPPIPFPGTPEIVAFHRTELSAILTVYGRQVAAGEWRDYGIAHRRDHAVFAIYRRTAENPVARVEKHPGLRARQGQYLVRGPEGQVLKRGNDLAQVLRVLEPRRLTIID
jgi:hypothetical protein